MQSAYLHAQHTSVDESLTLMKGHVSCK